MKEISIQVKDNVLHPFSEDDREILREYKPNQILRCKLSGIQKPRSLIQMRLYWSTCQVVADNTDQVAWNTKAKVDFQCRVKLHFADADTVVVKPDGTIAYKYLSIAFRNLPHIMACNYFDRSFAVMAKFLGVSAEKLIEQVNSQ
jgi:hypothetical protein